MGQAIGRRLAPLFAEVAALAALSACGGGGGDTPPPTPPPPPAAAGVDFPNSVALGATGAQDLRYVAADGTTLAQVIATSATTLLPAGTTPLPASWSSATLPQVVVACVSGSGETTNVVTGIDLGVLVQSAAVLLGPDWASVDATAAWQAAVGSGAAWSGWENCGAKPEGAPSPSSRLVPSADGGYAEDVYDGNPGTTFNTVSQVVDAAQVTAMLGTGALTTADPARPLRLTLRAWDDGAGRRVFIEQGEPVPGAPAGTVGFVAIYVPAS